METKELRSKLIKDFGKFIEDDSKLEILESFFDTINQDAEKSVISDSHYNLVEDERAKYISGENETSSWEAVEKRLKAKYDL